MKAKLILDLTGPKTPENPEGKLPAGTIMDNPDAYMLVQGGVAEPADDECETRAGLTAEEFERAKYQGLRRELHIHPDDHEPYRLGYMVGYNGDGSWKPGPNYDAWLAEQEQDDEEDDDDE